VLARGTCRRLETLALRATAGISAYPGAQSPSLEHDDAAAHNTVSMLFPSFAVLAGLFSLSVAHNIQMKAHQRECFHESLHKDDKMTVTFQVGDREFGGSGNLEVDFWVRQWQHEG
jgi:hypothetical protein